MSTNHTPNYSLSQWERTDQVLMEDFNADNAKIDSALKAEADARNSADSAMNTQLAKKGNCRIWTTTYTGDGTYSSDNPKTFTFPGKPALIMILTLAHTSYMLLPYGASYGSTVGQSLNFSCDLIWNGNSVSLVGTQGANQQMNSENVSYLVVALIAADK